ncbi:hypothetical protein [Nocardioides antri]|uniref:Uncharacterized protein n=1 Tax=Nocardioides antri TaxID=2607659 RepID=A0A5B1M4C0_9ACTN|nr:hypothetical protein [Nocardioides antri]KAA1427782.1 hypothetical protein F0U47_10165 [Nocardioides antri]
MSKGRHSAAPAAGHRRSTTGLRKATPGARKAPPEARKASPARVGGARVAGRRVAQGDGRPVVLTAIGSGEKLFALLPLAILSVASVAGLTALGNGDPAASPSPADPGTAAGSPRHETAPRQVPARLTPSSAPTTAPETAPTALTSEGAAGEAVDEERASPDEPVTVSPRVEPPAGPVDRPAGEEPTTPVPPASPTATPEPTPSDSITRAEAIARCLESGITAVDVLALKGCVADLLG